MGILSPWFNCWKTLSFCCPLGREVFLWSDSQDILTFGPSNAAKNERFRRSNHMSWDMISVHGSGVCEVHAPFLIDIMHAPLKQVDDSSIISKFEAPCWLGDIEQTLPTSQPRRLAGFNQNDITDIPMMKGWVCSLFHRGFFDSSVMIPDITFTYQDGSRRQRPRTRSVLQENSSLTRTDYLITSVTLSSSFIAKTIKHRKLNCSHPTMCVDFLGVDTQKDNRDHPFG